MQNVKGNSLRMHKLLFFILLALCIPLGSYASSLVVVPSSASYAVGNSFVVLVQARPEGELLHKVQGTLVFDAKTISLISIEDTESIVSSWVQKPIFSNALGTVSFEGLVDPGFADASGTVFALTFRPKVQGVGTLNFSQGSIISQEGTDALKSLGKGRYNFVLGTLASPEKVQIPSAKPGAPEIVSLTHPDQHAWYSHNDPVFTWSVSGDIDQVSYAFDQQEDTDPIHVDETVISKKSYKDVEDGVWYFHLNLHNEKGWGKLAHYKILVDTESPQEFQLHMEERNDPADPRLEVGFTASDALSGIDRYEARVKGKDPVMLSPEAILYETPILSPGSWNIEVYAYDKAGNSRSAFAKAVVEPLIAPSISMHSKSVKDKEILAMSGITVYPQASLLVYFQDQASNEVLGPFQAKVDGMSWYYRHQGYLPDGVYMSWAVVKDDRGASSAQAENVEVFVGRPWYMKIASLIAEYLALGASLVIIPVGTLLFLAYMVRAIRILVPRKRKSPLAKRKKAKS